MSYEAALLALFTDSPSEGELILEEIVCVEEGQGLHEVSHDDREGVLEEVVRTFLEGDADERVQIAGVSTLQFLGERLITIVSQTSEFERHGDRRGDRSREHRGGNLSQEVEFESSENSLPAIVHPSERSETSAPVECANAQCVLRTVVHSLAVVLQLQHFLQERTRLREILWLLVSRRKQTPVLNQCSHILLHQLRNHTNCRTALHVVCESRVRSTGKKKIKNRFIYYYTFDLRWISFQSIYSKYIAHYNYPLVQQASPTNQLANQIKLKKINRLIDRSIKKIHGLDCFSGGNHQNRFRES